LPRHFAKNRTRLLKATLNDGSVVTGRITENSENSVTLEVAEKKIVKPIEIAFTDIKRAVVEIEFNRKDDK
jgi:ribosome maturation factor RimP